MIQHSIATHYLNTVPNFEAVVFDEFQRRCSKNWRGQIRQNSCLTVATPTGVLNRICNETINEFLA